MAFVIVFLLVIGVVSVGAEKSTTEAATANAVVDARAEPTVAGVNADRGRSPCRYGDGPPIQRDLTVPHGFKLSTPRHVVEELSPMIHDD